MGVENVQKIQYETWRYLSVSALETQSSVSQHNFKGFPQEQDTEEEFWNKTFFKKR